MEFKGNTNEYIELVHINQQNCQLITETVEDALSIIWFETSNNQLVVDGVTHAFNQNEVAFLTEFHKIQTKKIDRIRFLRFNKPFYCVIENDVEVGCRGALFFGASQLPVINVPPNEIEKFEILWKMFEIEMCSSDHLQIEMLQTMLKRYLILCTRIYKIQKNFPDIKEESDVVREFNYLVEYHFKTKHTVSEYAMLMNKSPKTLSNIFLKVNSKPPLQYIQDRIMLEARRLLHYSDLQIQEVAYQLGFDSVQSFSRFFKKKQGISPSAFK
jgi:AraC-like DNA-binding protein